MYYDKYINMKTSKSKKIIPACILLATVSLCGCAGRNNTAGYQKSGLYFDTAVSVEIYASSPEEAEPVLEECMNICAHYQDMFDAQIITSDIANINSSAGKSVTVDEDTVLLLEEALKYCSLSGGAFDISIKPVTELWDFHEGAERIPSDEELQASLKHVDWNNISVDPVNNTVTLNDPDSSIDLGAVAKGYVADKITEYLESLSITGAIVNMGGDMRLIGTKPDGSMFNIGINDPFDSGSVSMALYLSDTSVATSGTYERCFEKDGVLYHHILDPQTGMPCDTDIRSVTVITKSATDADCLCTVCILKGSSQSLSLIERIPDTEAVFITNDGSVLTTSGAERLIRH